MAPRGVAVSFQWRVPPSIMAAGVALYSERMEAQISNIAVDEAESMALDAKATHPWNNRTTMAETTLAGIAENAPGLHTIYLTHGVYYGIYLELRWGGRYAVIMPVMTSHYAPIMDKVRAAIGG